MRYSLAITGCAAAILSSAVLAHAQDAPADAVRVEADQATHVANLGADEGDALTVWLRIDPESNAFVLNWTVDPAEPAPDALQLYCEEDPGSDAAADLILVDALGTGSVVDGEVNLTVELHDLLQSGECSIAAETEGDTMVTGVVEPANPDGGM